MIITPVTRTEIIDNLLLAERPFHGRMDLLAFLGRVWPLSNMSSTDTRFENAEGDIWQHMVRNEDWTYEYLLTSRLNVLSCEDDIFLRFLATCLHPLAVRDEKEAEELALLFNKYLEVDGYRLVITSHISGRPVYSGMNIETSRHVNLKSSVYEVVLSFAGEDRSYVEKVAEKLREQDVRCFYDRYEVVTLWGKDLVEHLDQVYSSARYCIMFISRYYAEKVWPNHERRSALARAVEQHEEYILPVRFDDTEIPGIRHTIGYVDLRVIDPDGLAGMILQKLGRRIDM